MAHDAPARGARAHDPGSPGARSAEGEEPDVTLSSGTPPAVQGADDERATAPDRRDRRPLAGAALSLPAGARAVGAWSVWALVVGTFLYFAVQLAVALGTILLTFLAGLLLTALLRPVVSWLDRKGMPRLAATWLVVVGFLLLVGGLLWFLWRRVSGELSSLRGALTDGLERIRTYLTESAGLSRQQVDSVFDQLIAQVAPGGSGGGGAAAGTGMVVPGVTALVAVAAAVVLAVFTAFWLCYGGERAWQLTIRVVPADRREVADDAGQHVWETLGGYLRAVTIVAFIDAVGIGLALVLIGVPLPFALALLTFLGAYVPIVGAFLAGMAAVVVAFASGGLTDAMWTLGAVILVQQVEGNVLQPIVMRRTVYLHPLVTLYALSIGGLLWGLAGAIVAVPLVAVVYAIAVTLARRRGEEDAARPRRRGVHRWLGTSAAGGGSPPAHEAG